MKIMAKIGRFLPEPAMVSSSFPVPLVVKSEVELIIVVASKEECRVVGASVLILGGLSVASQGIIDALNLHISFPGPCHTLRCF